MKVAVVGVGYVGLSNALLLSQHNEVFALDIDCNKVDLLKNKVSPIDDKDIQEYLQKEELNFTATIDEQEAYLGADYVIISTPTDYDELTDYFDTKTIEIVN